MIRIGTSGFSYKDWEGPFYPSGLPARDKLSYYAREFDTVEVDSSYYGIPKASTLAAMAAKTPPGFLFCLKAFQGMTHAREDNAAVFGRFIDALTPWIEQERLGCVLAQFPSSFRNTPGNRDYLRQLAERMGAIPTVVEFRHRDWITHTTFDLLRSLELGFCCVDQPRFANLVPPVAVATSAIGYVRFHGRNAAKWWRHEHAWERYDYTYARDELVPWAPKIQRLAETTRVTFVYANNHWVGQAIDTARQLRLLLGFDAPAPADAG